MRLLALAALVLTAAAQCEQSYRVYTEHPRLWLNARRLRLLQRERERDSIRWQQFQTVVKGREPMPEEPLIRALEHQVTRSDGPGKQAVAWAVQRTASTAPPDAAELRLMAIVFDWCYSVFAENERRAVADRMVRGVAALSSQTGWPAFAAWVLAAVALADDWPGSEQALREAFEKRWAESLLPALRRGRGMDRPADQVALLEVCHVVRDNLHLDLWTQAPVFFRQFPSHLLLGYYPAPVQLAGHPFRQRAAPMKAPLDPARDGELARRADLLIAAYDTNSNEVLFLQGWLAHDLYRLRSVTGAVYEYLWMNPYQPGLSYYSAPLFLYDELSGDLVARSSWDDDAAWVGYLEGELQLWADGQRSLVGATPPGQPIVFPMLAVARVTGEADFRVRVPEGSDVFLVGLEAGKTYWVAMGEAKAVPRVAEAGGVLPLKVEPGE